MPERPTHAKALFAPLGPSYDRVGAVLSFGQDPRWRRLLVSRLPRDGGQVLEADRVGVTPVRVVPGAAEVHQGITGYSRRPCRHAVHLVALRRRHGHRRVSRAGTQLRSEGLMDPEGEVRRVPQSLDAHRRDGTKRSC